MTPPPAPDPTTTTSASNVASVSASTAGSVYGRTVVTSGGDRRLVRAVADVREPRIGHALTRIGIGEERQQLRNAWNAVRRRASRDVPQAEEVVLALGLGHGGERRRVAGRGQRSPASTPAAATPTTAGRRCAGSAAIANASAASRARRSDRGPRRSRRGQPAPPGRDPRSRARIPPVAGLLRWPGV